MSSKEDTVDPDHRKTVGERITGNMNIFSPALSVVVQCLVLYLKRPLDEPKPLLGLFMLVLLLRIGWISTALGYMDLHSHMLFPTSVCPF
jgi:hypothetical protein